MSKKVEGKGWVEGECRDGSNQKRDHFSFIERIVMSCRSIILVLEEFDISIFYNII